MVHVCIMVRSGLGLDTRSGAMSSNPASMHRLGVDVICGGREEAYLGVLFTVCVSS